jgi:hypothetical protein
MLTDPVRYWVSDGLLSSGAEPKSRRQEIPMSDQDAKSSDLVEIAKRNGDFRKNWGLIIGALLYLRSMNAVRGRSLWWNWLFFLIPGAVEFLRRHW